MVGRAKLIVAEPVKGDSGVARIDKSTMTYLGIISGGEIDVFGGIFSPSHIRVKAIELSSEDEGKGIIRISSEKMREGDFKIGMKVTVDTSWLKTMKDSLSLKKKKEES